jgi:hypothetical protein
MGIGAALTRFLGMGGGGVDTSYTSDLGFGQSLQGLGEVRPEWAAAAEAARELPSRPTAGMAERESRKAGELSAMAAIQTSIAQSRKKQIRAWGKMINSQIQVDQAVFATASQVAQTQAQAAGQMAQLDFQNRMVGAELGGKVSAFRESHNIFNL